MTKSKPASTLALRRITDLNQRAPPRIDSICPQQSRMSQLRFQKVKKATQSPQHSLFLILNTDALHVRAHKLPEAPNTTKQKEKITYSPNFAQMASDTLRMISEPSKKTESQIFKTVWLGRHVAKRVRNHCIVKTLVSGGSYPPEIKQTLHVFKTGKLQDIKILIQSSMSTKRYIS